MILTQDQRNIQTFGEIKRKKFTIEQNRKSFRALMGTLYPDAERAVVKELSANALDSHIKAGKRDVPFEVHLPSLFEPNLIIRDFGVSMDDDFMMNQYTAAFHSSKDGRNDENGAYGLGRLSLLSICDSYLATCFLNGIKRVYSIFIDEDGEPCISHISEEQTDEPDGFLIEAAVNSDSAPKIEEAAKNIFQLFKPYPIVKNRDDFIVIEDKYIILAEDGSFGLKGKGHDSCAIMGCYSYKINPELVSNLTNIQSEILKSGLMLHFDLGELNVAVNRESLNYNSFTVNSIKSKIDSIIPKIKPVILGHFNNKTGLESIDLYTDLLSYDGSLYNISDLVREFVKDLKISSMLDFQNFDVTTFTFNSYKHKIQKSVGKIIQFRKNLKFVYCDKRANSKGKAEKYFSDSGNHAHSLVFVSGSSFAIEEFESKYNIDVKEFVAASTMPHDSVAKITGAKGKVMKYYRGQGHYNRKIKDLWEEDNAFDSSKEIFYVLRSGYYIGWNTNSRKVKDFDGDIKALEIIAEQKDIVVYGLTAKQIKNKESHWKDFYSTLDEEKKKWSKKQEEMISIEKYFRVKYSSYPKNILEKLKGAINKDTLLFQVVSEYEAIQKKLGGFNSYSLGVEKEKIPLSKDYSFSTDTIDDNYPLLLCLNSVYSIGKEAFKDLVNYVNQKETTKAKETVDTES